ncbi:MAG: hypothetical protein ACE37F_15790 [Nannocystaceae bacterium]|nr:hypothetical protein [bacterium]
MALHDTLRLARTVGWLAPLAAAAAALVPSPSSASSQVCEGGTHLLHPADGGSTEPGTLLVFADRSCTRPDGVEPSAPIVMIAVEDLHVEVDGETASLVRFEEVERSWLWRIEPPPPPGALVRIFGCDLAEREGTVCYEPWTPSTQEGPLLEWSFTVQGEPSPVALVEPVIAGLREGESTDPYSGEKRALWTFSLERGESDPGTPMFVDVNMQPGDAVAAYPFLGVGDTAKTVVLGAPQGEDVCVEARTFDLYGNEGPTATACADAEGQGCGCTTGGGAGGLWALLAVFSGLRRRPRP